MTPFLLEAVRAAMKRWPVADQERAQERAAVRQYEGGETRERAEAAAYIEVEYERKMARRGRGTT